MKLAHALGALGILAAACATVLGSAQAAYFSVGDTFRDCPECPEMVVVRAGGFMMGSPESEEGRRSNEGPIHQVTFWHWIAIGKHEVTRGQYAAFSRETNREPGGCVGLVEALTKEENPSLPYTWQNPGHLQTDNHPVVCVSHNDARAYIEWLKGKTGYWYRLLSEAEWEYAARAGTGAARYWAGGANNACSHANIGDRSFGENYVASAFHDCRDGYIRTAPIGKFGANAFGIHDMLGNVSEWVEDCSDSYRNTELIVETRPLQVEGCGKRVVRGGSWVDGPNHVRLAHRDVADPNFRLSNKGFRVARIIEVRDARLKIPFFDIVQMDQQMVATADASVRSGPDTSYESLIILISGEAVSVTGRTKDDEWYRIAIAGELPGFVHKNLLQENRGTPKRAKILRDCLACPVMVEIPAGEFMMGSPDDEEGRSSDEGPVHRAAVSQPFAIGMYEVTVGQFEMFENAVRFDAADCPNGGVQGQRWRDRWVPGFRQTDEDPIVCVSHDEVKAYIEWLSWKGRHQYRLPTEAEWEYAARAGTDTARYWGSNENKACGYANVGDLTGKKVNDFDWRPHRCDDGYAQTAPVGSFKANEFGLHDMLGNVWEWADKCGHCWFEVIRGGAWDSPPGLVRSASRVKYATDERGNNLGFRVVRTDDFGKIVPLDLQMVAVKSAEVHSGSATPHEIIYTLSIGDEVSVTGRAKYGRWYRIALADGRSGFVFHKYLEEKGTFRDCTECPPMVVVPSGEFMMGSPKSEAEREKHEGPLRRVLVRQPFAIGKYEVTFAEWDTCVADNGCNGYRPDGMGWGRGDWPVVNVSWEDAKAYAEWLSRKTGHAYRLPSEAEWEYAARAGTETPFHFGKTINTDQANYNGYFTYRGGRSGIDRLQATPVGSFPPNAFGLHDVHGNVQEWVEDCVNNGYVGAPSDTSVWTAGDCDYRIRRGGSYEIYPGWARSAWRSNMSTDFRHRTIGFRIAKSLP
jgi:formylglycine-generating enzyme required for sulfatase activity